MCDASYLSCINIVIQYTNAAVSFSDFYAIYISDLMRNFSNMMCSTCSGFLYHIRYSCSNPLFFVWSNPLATIWSVFYDPVHSDIINLIWSYLILSDLIWSGLILFDLIRSNTLISLWSTHSALILLYILYSDHSNPIQSNLLDRSYLLCSVHSASCKFYFCFK